MIMQVSSTTNQYQALQTQQNPITLPVQPQDPTYSNSEIYEASHGNIIRSEDGELALTPQGETNITNAQNDAVDTAEVQAENDAARGVGVDYLSASSKRSQVEIYLAVATDGRSSSDNQTADIINELREVQKQNNAVQAYATYQEAQKSARPANFLS